MLAYIVRRLLYAIPILIGVNVITFTLFFVVNSPDDMARVHLGVKRVTPEAVARWKRERGYDRPLLFNAETQCQVRIGPFATCHEKLTDTIFFEKSIKLFAFDFGRSDQGRDIGYDIKTRMWPSLAIALPVFLMGLAAYITFALLMAFFRATYVDFWGVVLCVLMMSISGLFYIIGGQYIAGKLWNLVPISGYDGGLNSIKFLVLPVLV
ncbi:MAG TPA: ABC transporter permease, partial [Burkholderiales bacterium]|nr:ABC transporter permease [Burkholderiales bacterium]